MYVCAAPFLAPIRRQRERLKLDVDVPPAAGAHLHGAMLDSIREAPPDRDCSGAGRERDASVAVAVKVVRLERTASPIEPVISSYPGIVRRIGPAVGSDDGDARGNRPAISIERAQPYLASGLPVVPCADFKLTLGPADYVLQPDLCGTGAV